MIARALAAGGYVEALAPLGSPLRDAARWTVDGGIMQPYALTETELRAETGTAAKRHAQRKLAALIAAVEAVESSRPASAARTDAVGKLASMLEIYENTGDHDHGRGPIAAGGSCQGGDCWVAKARGVLQDACGHAVWSAQRDAVVQRCVRCGYRAVQS